MYANLNSEQTLVLAQLMVEHEIAPRIVIESGEDYDAPAQWRVLTLGDADPVAVDVFGGTVPLPSKPRPSR